MLAEDPSGGTPDLEVRISGARIAFGAIVLVAGPYLWALARLVANVADARPPGSPDTLEARPDDAPPGSR